MKVVPAGKIDGFINAKPMSSIAASGQRAASVRAEIANLWRLAWPMLIGQVATVGMGVADVAMTGHASADALAAVSLGTSVWLMVLVTVMGIMMAINTVVAHEIGAGRYDKIPHTVRAALWKGLIVGLIGCAAANLCTLLFDHIGLEPGVAHQASLFLHVISVGMPAFACYRALYGYTTSINATRPVMVIALAGWRSTSSSTGCWCSATSACRGSARSAARSRPPSAPG